eukprot:9487220-Pyramimonas_sp.AAC.1
MEVWYTELHDKRELLEATPVDDLCAVPTHMITDDSVLVTVAEEQRGRLPKWGYSRDPGTEETYHVPLCSTVEDHSHGLDSDENGQYVELCCAAEMSKVVLSEQQRRILDADRVTTMRFCYRRCKTSCG